MNLVAADVSPLKLKEVRADSRRLLRAGGVSWSQCMRQSKRRLSMNRGLKFFSGLFVLVAGALPVDGGVIINEIMYHPASTNVLEEWVELLNTGPTNVNLSGWQFTRGVRFAFPTNTTLAAGGYVVIPAEAATFAAKYPGVTNVVAASAGPLEGHTIELRDNAGQSVNSVSYSHDGDWAVRRMGPLLYDHQGWEWYAAHDGSGPSLE